MSKLIKPILFLITVVAGTAFFIFAPYYAEVYACYLFDYILPTRSLVIWTFGLGVILGVGLVICGILGGLIELYDNFDWHKKVEYKVRHWEYTREEEQKKKEEVKQMKKDNPELEGALSKPEYKDSDGQLSLHKEEA